MLKPPDGIIAPQTLDAYLIVHYRSSEAEIRAALGGSLEPAGDWVRLVWRRPLASPQLATCRAIVSACRGAMVEERAVARFPGGNIPTRSTARLAVNDAFATGTLHAGRDLIAAATLFDPCPVAADPTDLPPLGRDVAVLRILRGRVDLFCPSRHRLEPLLPALGQVQSGVFLLTSRANAQMPAVLPPRPFSAG